MRGKRQDGSDEQQPEGHAAEGSTVTRAKPPLGRYEPVERAGSFGGVTELVDAREVSAAPQPLALRDLGAAGGASKFVDNGGAVLQVVQVQLVFWGNAWTSTTPAPNPSAAQITAAVDTMLRGPYLLGLAQYRGIGRGFLRGAATIASSNPPAAFTDAQVAAFVTGQITAGALPALDVDNQTLYVVVMPRGTSSSNASFIGEHTFTTDASGRRVRYAWITNSGALSSITRIISHEIVEACTDPEGSGFTGVAGTCSQTGWCEIGDICSTTSVLDGVTVQTYWSDQAAACVVPAWPAMTFPFAGVQFRGSLAANQTRRWFTFNWPEWWRTQWRMLPTSIRPGAAQLTWTVDIERASGAFLTYWISVTNLTALPVDFEGRFCALGR